MVIKRIESLCTISKEGCGGHAGSPIVLRPWQRQLILRLFARRPDGKRRHRLAMIGMPRKNGKSALGSGFAIDGLLFDGVGAEVYSAAAEMDQARIVFTEAKRTINANEELKELCHPMRNVIEVPQTNSIYRVLSAEAYSKEGLNISRSIIDELHAHPTDELFNVLLNGTGAREEPMTIVITTAGVMSDSTGRDSVCYSQYKHGVDVALGVEDDPSMFFAWWGAPDGADHKDPEVWRKANPGYGDILNSEDIADAVIRLPENEFRTKRLNQWVASKEAWLPSGAWDKLADPEHVVAKHTRVVIGFDGSRKRDATVLIGVTVEAKPHLFVIGWWERSPDDPPDWQVPAGNVVHAIRQACKDYDVAEVAVDQSLWQTELEDLEAEGLPIVQHSQRATMMVPATQRFYEAVVTDSCRTDPRRRPAPGPTLPPCDPAPHVVRSSALQRIEGLASEDRRCNRLGHGVPPVLRDSGSAHRLGPERGRRAHAQGPDRRPARGPDARATCRRPEIHPTPRHAALVVADEVGGLRGSEWPVASAGCPDRTSRARCVGVSWSALT